MNDRDEKQKGKYGEDVAAGYLEDQGYEILERNYRYGKGEIDIVALDHDILVFVEVKYARDADDEFPEDRVTPRKRTQIRTIAEGYMDENDLHDTDCRCDVIAVMGKGTGVTLRHLKDAF